jgi:hypothetical protein
MLVFHQIHGAKADKRLAASFQGAEAEAEILLYRHFKMGCDLIIELGVEMRLAEK